MITMLPAMRPSTSQPTQFIYRLFLLSLCGAVRSVRAAPQHGSMQRPLIKHHVSQHEKVPAPTDSGYLDVHHELSTKMFYAYYEAREQVGDTSTTPIILWLQGGPGCSSFFGMLYINGPYFVNEDDLTLRHNPGSWNRLYGMLFVEQPLGVGFSTSEPQNIPKNELDVARDLFNGLQSFYRKFPQFQDRSLIITGESYAGKYVPSIAHYILQLEATMSGYADQLAHPRHIPAEDVQGPLFQLGGMAIGNGFTDAETQTLVQAQVAWSLGLIDYQQKAQAEEMEAEVVKLVQNRQWKLARVKSDELNAFIANASGTATLEDVRRNIEYDGNNAVEKFLNQQHVKQALKAPGDVAWSGCSPAVDAALSGDVMKSVKHLVQDLLLFKPVLLYQGQFDAECGVASNDAWVSTMPWHGHNEYKAAARTLWRVNGRVAGFSKQHDNLKNVVIRNTGHMTPHDNPLYSQLMIEKWIEESIGGRPYTRDQDVTPDLERAYMNPDEGQNTYPGIRK